MKMKWNQPVKTAEIRHNIFIISIKLTNGLIIIKIGQQPYSDINHNFNVPKLDEDRTETVTVVAWADFVFLPLSTSYARLFILHN